MDQNKLLDQTRAGRSLYWLRSAYLVPISDKLPGKLTSEVDRGPRIIWKGLIFLFHKETKSQMLEGAE